jgi:hypothetical protein
METPSSVVEELVLGRRSSLDSDDCNYKCQVTGYDPNEILNFTTSNEECYSSGDGMAGTT